MQQQKSLSPWGASGITPNISPIYPDYVHQPRKSRLHAKDNSDLVIVDNTNYVVGSPQSKKPPLHSETQHQKLLESLSRSKLERKTPPHTVKLESKKQVFDFANAEGSPFTKEKRVFAPNKKKASYKQLIYKNTTNSEGSVNHSTNNLSLSMKNRKMSPEEFERGYSPKLVVGSNGHGNSQINGDSEDSNGN